MPRIYLCFVWHMHQPFYKDLATGEYKLPWTRMHALKDYYGMVKVLAEFPRVRQTFNLVPSMLVQLEEYAAGAAADPFLRCALRPAESLTEDEQDFLLRYFFQANPARLIYRYPRYGELYDAWRAADRNPRRARRFFDSQAYRDVQVLSQLAWFDEEFLQGDAEVRALVARGRNYTLEDQVLMGRKQLEIVGAVRPVYAEFAARGQIEISTTPFYHPILPLVCDSDIASTAHPGVTLPARFRYPEDARRQLEMARDYMSERLGGPPTGLWPSEGSVSDEVLAIAAETGYRWLATDNGVLSRTLGRAAGAEETCRPYLWRQAGRQIGVLFRDHYLSDLIGFVYSKMGPEEAAAHFLDRVRENSRSLLARGRDVLVPIILDGENAWEFYDRNGRPFLRELYRRISDDGQMEAATVSEALARVEPAELGEIFPASWINANFDIWIGAEEDNKAWEYLLAARQAFDRVTQSPQGAALPEDRLRLAREELLIAEGSDWCWWYGPQHDSENRPEFDQLYRSHLANVYRALGLEPPEQLSRPILKTEALVLFQAPAGLIRPVIDGLATSYFEWLGAGECRADSRSGAMHGRRPLIRALYFGCDGQNLYLRLDFTEDAAAPPAGLDARFVIEPSAARPVSLTVSINGAGVAARGLEATVAFQKILEVALPLAALGAQPGDTLRLQLSVWQKGLPVDALPQEGWLEFSTADPSDSPL